MSGVGTAAAALLAAALAWAAVAKARRPRGTAISFEALGVPAARAMARAVPVAEAVVAGVMLWRPRAGAVLALAMLVVFSAVLARAVRSGRAVSCACFGTSGTRPVSVVELARNAGFALLAAVALVPARPVAPALPDVVLVTVGAALGAVALTAVELRSSLGRLWDNRLAGEAAR